ncbi:MAG: ABC transporter permease subunit [Rhodospirillaceae bacterium]|nr:ABC transporter permease subunit [Rhodospirillaceae bacterium]
MTDRSVSAAVDVAPHHASALSRLMRRMQSGWRSIVVFIPYVWLLLFFLLPFFIVAKISVAQLVIASPPFTDMIKWTDDGVMSIRLAFDNFAYIFEDDLYVKTYINSLKISSISTILCLLIGYPIAYGIIRSGPVTRKLLLFAIILPFWTSFLLRVYAWMGLLADQGNINNLLIWLGLIDEPIRLMYSEFAVYVGIVYTYLPFMILPLYANMEKLDATLNEAAADLGSRPTNTFLKITLPLTMPGIIAGSLLVFIPATGEYVIPDLLGGGNVLMIGRLLFNEFHQNVDWPTASAVAIVLLFLLVLPMIIYQYYQAKATEEP